MRKHFRLVTVLGCTVLLNTVLVAGARAGQVSTQKPIDRTVTKIITSQEKGKPFTDSFRTIVALGPAAIPTLMHIAQDSSVPIYQRWTATRAVGRIGDESAAVKLIGLLKVDDPVIRMAALHALGDLGVKQVVPEILATAEEDRAMVVRMTAVEVLGQLKADEALPVLEKTFRDERNFIKGKSLFIRRHAIAAMGQIGNRGATPILIKALDDADESIAPTAVRSLQEITGLNFEAKNQATMNQHWKEWWEKELKRIPQAPVTTEDPLKSEDAPADKASDKGEISQL